MQEYDLIVIGGGPGGYVCAIRAAQLGLRVALIEKGKNLGGTCVNVGCIPSKALLESSHKYSEVLHSSKEHGIELSNVKLNLTQMMKRKTNIVKELTDGLNFLMKKNKIQVFSGVGYFEKQEKKDRICVSVINNENNKDSKNKTSITAKKCVIATGSESLYLPHIPVDGSTILDSTSALSLSKVPNRLLIIGAGVIGLEMGSIWNRLGSQVTIVETMPRLLMPLDVQMSNLATRILEKQGLKFYFEHECIAVQKKKLSKDKKKKEVLEVILKNIKNNKPNTQETNNKEKPKDLVLECDQVLVAVGRRAYTDGLGLENIGLSTNKRAQIEVNPHTLESQVQGVYAIGDVIAGPMLAHKAEEEGVKVAETLAGHFSHVNYNAVPWVIYTWPEIAWVGRSEEELKKENVPYNIGKFIFNANGRAKSLGETQGQVRFLAHQETDEILGACIIGPNASELIAEAVIALEFGASADDLGRSFHAHPTLSEIMKEAALDVQNRAIHS